MALRVPIIRSDVLVTIAASFSFGDCLHPCALFPFGEYLPPRSILQQYCDITSPGAGHSWLRHTCMNRSSRQGAHKDLVDGIPPEGTSPILTTNVDGFAHEEMPHLAAVTEVGARAALPNPKGNEDSEDDPSLLFQDDKVQNVDWVIERGGEVRR